MNEITRSASFLLALLVLFPSFSQAQQVPYEVTFVAMDEESGERLRMAKNLLENALETRGAHQSESGWLFLIGLSGANESGEVAFSITLLSKLKESVVQLGRREQAFYRPISEQDPEMYPESGRPIRESMSEDYMRQFVRIRGHYVEMTSRSELAGAIESMVDQLYADHFDH